MERLVVVNIDFTVQHVSIFPLEVFMSYHFLDLCIFCDRLTWHSIKKEHEICLFSL